MNRREKSRLYDGLPSATNREWGPDRSNNAYTYGQQGLGGYGDFNGPPRPRHGGERPRGYRGRGPRGYVRSDERIADDIIGRLTDDAHVDAQREVYRARLERLRAVLATAGVDAPLPAGGFYLWAESPGGDGPRGYVRSDERIADDIVLRLTDDEHVDASQVLVMVEGGVATLTGNVPERRMKHRAEDIAADATGVSDVRNAIRVDDGTASFGQAGEAVRTPNWR